MSSGPRLLLRPEAEPVLVAAGEQQQVIGDPGQPRGLVRGDLHGIGQLLAGPARAPGQLQFAAEHREGRPQLVAGVGGEGPLPGQCALEPAQHFVHRAGQGGNLVLGRRDLDAWFPAVLGQCGDLAPQALDRRQGGARQPVGAKRRDGDEDPAADGQLPDHMALGGVEPVQGNTGDGNPAWAAGQWPGGDSLAFPRRS